MLLFGKQKAYDAYFKILENEKDSGALSEIISAAAKYNFGGKLWQTFIAWLIINDENPYSLACERRECSSPSLCAIAALDMKELFDAFNIRHNGILGSDFCGGKGFGGQCEYIGNLASQLASHLSAAADISEFKGCIDSFFAEYGVGLFGLNKAFHIENHAQLTLKPADSFDPVRFSDLWGYEIQKKELIDNTELFLSGRSANNVLLYGDSGTGKSTAIKALLNEYSDQGLRIIEVYKHQFGLLPELCDMLKHRSYFFIIFMDDLSFEDFEIEYKYLKALIEGGLEPKPKNILIYATSNRRHLIKENNSDRDDSDDRHRSDTIQEKLSLSERFGVSIYYPKPISAEYNEIVLHLAELNHIAFENDELLRQAHIWGMEHGRLSGRTAQQFINSLKKTGYEK